MEIGANGDLALHHWTFETEMSRDRPQCRVLEIKEKMERVRCDHEMDGADAQIKKLFNGVHGHP